MTQKRELPPRAAATEVSAPTITLKLSKRAIEELQLLDPVKLAKLVDIIDAVTGRGAPQKTQAPPQNPPPPVPIPQPPPVQPPRVPRTREAIRQRIAAQFGQPTQVLPTGRTREAVRQRIAARFPNMQQRVQGLHNYVMVQ